MSTMMQQRTKIADAVSRVGDHVTLMGWISSKRDHGKITFVDLRDATGILQCVGQADLSSLPVESVVALHGVITQRPDRMVNADQPFGAFELSVNRVEVLNRCLELPIPIEDDGYDINEEQRLKYRYLDLRRARLQKTLRLRSQFAQLLRTQLAAQKFVEIETPLLTKSTKEGSRDFIVPSRLHPGSFYALPQSPQQYKQLLMTAGFERYFQFAKCVRDEDLRADRGFEHTQLDLELSFVERDDVMKTVEAIMTPALQAIGAKLQHQKFPVITYQDALQKYGADKFDPRSEAEKKAGVLAFTWVVDFPFFKQVDQTDAAEVADGKSGWTFTHNPFSQPKPEFLSQHLAGKNLGEILTTQYDLVCNGYEVGGGSIRAHDPAVLTATFRNMGYSDQEIESSIGHILRAFKLGTPPHGGIGMGFDRWVMLLAGEHSLKEAIAFPMSSSGKTAVMDAPAPVEPTLLNELQLQIAQR